MLRKLALFTFFFFFLIGILFLQTTQVLAAGPGYLELSGKVEFKGGANNNLAGVSIHIKNSQGASQTTIHPSADGRYTASLQLQSGSYTIVLDPPQGTKVNPNNIPFTIEEGKRTQLTSANFTLEPGTATPGSPGTGGPQGSAVSYEGCKGYGSKFGNVDVPNPLCIHGTTGGANKIILMGVTILLIAAIILAFFMLLWGGLAYILSGGSKDGMAAARKRITYAIIGLVLALLALVIFRTLGYVLGFDVVSRVKTSDEYRQDIIDKYDQQCKQRDPSIGDVYYACMFNKQYGG